MSRSQSRKSQPAQQRPGRRAHRKGRRHRRQRPDRSRALQWLGVFLMAILALGVLLLWRRPGPFSPAAQPPLPVLDLSRLDQAAANSIQKYLSQIQDAPFSGDAWGWFGGLLRIYDYPTEAQQCLQEAERLDPQNPRWPYFQSLLLSTRSADEAIAKARRAAQLCGNDPEMPRFHLARLLAEQGNWPEAARELNELIEAKPDFAPARMLLAHEAQSRADYDKAIALASQCTNDNQTARNAWALLAVLYQRTQKPDAAVQAADRASELPAPPNLPDPFETELAGRREDARNKTLYCHDLLAAGKLDQAAPLIKTLTEEHPLLPESWLLAGRLQILRKDFKTAEQSLRHHLRLKPQNLQGLFQLGTALLGQERFSEAADTLAEATSIKPDFGPAHFNRGFALANSGQPRQALQAFQESLKHNPEHIETYFFLADIHARLGEKQPALDILQQASVIEPDHPKINGMREWIRNLP